MAISEADRAHMLGLLQGNDPERFQILQEIWEYLRVSEQMMLDILEGRPQNASLLENGHPEFGHFLHYLNNPPAQLMALVAQDTIAQAAWNLVAQEAKPQSAIAPGYFENLRIKSSWWPRVADDGSIYGFGQYENLDVRWVGALVNLGIALTRKPYGFGTTPYTKELMPGEDGKIRLGIVGDWGTGAYGQNDGPAVAVMKQLAKQNCDYLFHLGDVYYAGTGADYCYPANEELNNFTDQWPDLLGQERSFALNSNHEMYAGGEGYFPQALGNGNFTHQNMTSYFALTFGNWVILGLDSAYHARAASLYMNGTLGDRQIEWIKQYGASIGGFGGKKILVMTHHEAQDFRGINLTKLHGEVTGAIGRAPDVWYWGHLHNGIAYSNSSAAGKLGTRARCVGHSAIPYGIASGLVDSSGNLISGVDYSAMTPSPEGGKRVLNGYVTVELSKNGGISEAFYEQDKPYPAWRSVNGIRFA